MNSATSPVVTMFQYVTKAHQAFCKFTVQIPSPVTQQRGHTCALTCTYKCGFEGIDFYSPGLAET